MSKIINYIVLMTAILLVVSVIPFAIGEHDNGNGNSFDNKKRVIAQSEEEISAAINAGCELVRETRGISAFICERDIADDLGLQEDIRVFAQDAGANSQIRANLVHNTGNTGAGRKIVVLDTGYNYNHIELVSSYLGGKDFVNNDSDPFDDNGHGSHVAGLITADGVLAGTRGTAPGAGIIAGKVLAFNGGGYFSDTITGIYWAVDGNDGVYGTADDFNADAVSMSLGSSPPYTYKGYCDNVYPALTNAIKYARDRKVVVVSAAGNNGGAGVSLPGCISYSLTVGAVDSKDAIASFSGKGNSVDISSPGVNLLSAVLGSNYAYKSGTSMATPVVSGVVALLKADNSTLTPAQTENALIKTAKDLGKRGKDSSYGYGRVDAYSAVNFI